MIICVYHGSSMKGVNETQTRPITERVKKDFKGHNVVEAYYSSHVLTVMERRNTPLLSYVEAILNCEEEEIIVFLSNLIEGEEYRNICKTIDNLNADKEIRITKPLINRSTVSDVASAIRTDNPSIYVGHGSRVNNADYRLLMECFEDTNQYVISLKDDFGKYLDDNVIENNITLKPLMLTCGYHAKVDIEKKMMEIANSKNYNVASDLTPLSANEKIIDIYMDNIKDVLN